MLAIRSAHMFDGECFVSGPATVILDGETISGVERGWPDVQAGIAVLDVGEATVLPGLVDTHVHLVGDSGSARWIGSPDTPRSSWPKSLRSHCADNSPAV